MIRNSGTTRRDMIAATVGGTLAFVMPNLTALSSPPNLQQTTGQTRKCMIVLFGEGGPSSQDSFDPKKGSSSTDSFFDESQTNVPGVRFAEPWKKLSVRADRMTIFRAHHTDKYALHALAVPDALQNVGADTNTFLSLAENTPNPVVFMNTPNVVEESAGESLRELFRYDRGLQSTWDSTDSSYSSPYDSIVSPGLQSRLQLRRVLDLKSPLKSQGKTMDRWQEVSDQAEELLSGTSKALRSIKISDIERYSNGQPSTPESLILLYAREFIRSGVASIVFVRTGGIGATKFQTYGWDHHYDAESLLKQNIPILDHTMAQLMDDLHPEKGMMPDTSLVFMTDMGRTPQISSKDGGRDHFAWKSSVVVSKNLQPGVIGSTDSAMIGTSGIINNRDFAGIVKNLMASESK